MTVGAVTLRVAKIGQAAAEPASPVSKPKAADTAVVAAITAEPEPEHEEFEMEFDDGDPEPEVEGIPLADDDAAKPARPKSAAKAAATTATPRQAAMPPRVRVQPKRTTRSPSSSSISSSTTRNDHLVPIAHLLHRITPGSHGRITEDCAQPCPHSSMCARSVPRGPLKNHARTDLRKNRFSSTRSFFARRLDCLTFISRFFPLSLLNFGNFADNRIDFWAKTL